MSYQLIVNQKENQDYRGPAEVCTYEFKLWPEQIPFTRWTAQRIMNAHNDKLAEQNSQLLELRMWEDTAPTWTTDYRVEVVASASPLWWNVIIIGVLVVLAIGGIAYTITQLEDITEYIGEKSPGAIPWMMIAGIAAVTVLGIYLVRR